MLAKSNFISMLIYRTRSALVLILLAITATCTVQAQKIDHMEPPFWWVGMKDPNLQIMLHGNKLAKYDALVTGEGVKLLRSIKTDNENYLFLDLEIGKKAKPGMIKITLGRKEIEYELKARQPGSAERNGFTPQDAIYLITPDRFANGNPDNDDIKGMRERLDRENDLGRHGGDIQGIIDHLDYISDLGFTAIWLNPILENDMPRFSYHGYAATDLYKVDRRFGSNEEYLAMIDSARSKDMLVIMDMIVNHIGSEHWWMKDMPAQDWINFPKEYVRTSHRRTVVQDPYASDLDKSWFFDGWFVKSMPDLNQRNPLVSTYLIQNSIWWVEHANIGGIRMDTYPYPDKEFMAEWSCRMMEEYPNFNIVGEEWVENPALVSHWQRGKINSNGFESCLPSLMDFPLQGAVKRALNDEESYYNNGVIQIYEMLAQDFLYPDPFNLVIFPDNHDMDRFYTQIGENLDLFKMGMVFYATMRGIPQIYYGTETLATNAKPRDHGQIRSDFPGGWEGDQINARTKLGLSADQVEAQNFVRQVFNWRKTADLVHHGKLMHFAPTDGVYTFFRYDDEKAIMVVLNKNKERALLPFMNYQEVVSMGIRATDVFTGKYQVTGTTFSVPAMSATIWEMPRRPE